MEITSHNKDFNLKGIKMPNLKYRFSAHFMSPNNHSYPAITPELEYINYDMKSKTGEANIRIPVDGTDVMHEINDLCTYGGCVLISTHDGRGSEHPTLNIYLEGVNILECPISHAYSDHGILGIKMTFSYETLKVFNPTI